METVHVILVASGPSGPTSILSGFFFSSRRFVETELSAQTAMAALRARQDRAAACNMSAGAIFQAQHDSADSVWQNILVRSRGVFEGEHQPKSVSTLVIGAPITEGKMTLVAMHAGGIDFTVTGKGFDPTVGKITTTHGDQDANSAGGVVATLGSAVLCTCSDTKLTQERDEYGCKRWVPKGNSSEAPVIVAGQKIGITKDFLEKALPQVCQIPFSSSRKLMVTITKTSGDSILKHCAPVGEYTAHIKGAPNYIMEKCTKYMSMEGQELPLDAAAKQGFMDKVDELSEQAMRVLAVATVKIGPVLPYGDDEDTVPSLPSWSRTAPSAACAPQPTPWQS